MANAVFAMEVYLLKVSGGIEGRRDKMVLTIFDRSTTEKCFNKSNDR